MKSIRVLSMFLMALLLVSLLAFPALAQHSTKDQSIRHSSSVSGAVVLINDPSESAVSTSITEEEVEEETGLEVSVNEFKVSNMEEPSTNSIVIAIFGFGPEVKLSLLERRAVSSTTATTNGAIATTTSYRGKISVTSGKVYNARGTSLRNLQLIETAQSSGFSGGSNGAVGVVTDDSGNEAPIMDDSNNGDTTVRAPDEPSRLRPDNSNSNRAITNVGTANLDTVNKILTITLNNGEVTSYEITNLERRPVRQSDSNTAGGSAGAGSSSATSTKPPSPNDFLERIFKPRTQSSTTTAQTGEGLTDSGDVETTNTKPSLFQRFRDFFFRKS